MKSSIALLFAVAALMFVGCANFVNTSQKSIAVAAGLGDGTMKAYAVYWKDRTNHLGDTPELEAQRQKVMAISFKVGASLNTATRTLDDYKNNVGTNTIPKAVVQALVQTAIQDAGSLAGEIAILTGDPTWSVKGK